MRAKVARASLVLLAPAILAASVGLLGNAWDSGQAGEMAGKLLAFSPRVSTVQPVINADMIRVGISDDMMENFEYPETRIAATGNYKILDKAGNNLVYEDSGQEPVVITLDKAGFWMRRESQPQAVGPLAGPLQVLPDAPGTMLKITNITRKKVTPLYRGTFEITRGYSAPNKLSVVNVLPIQDYLKAVVPNELPPRYGLEAVRAQAVAARNYAIRPREKAFPQFDMCDSQLCQVYFGAHTETPETNAALEETTGLIGLFNGEPILALYSSAHGGVAENYSYAFSDPKTNQFPAPPIPYLSGGPDIPEALKPFGDLRTEAAARAFWTRKDVPSYDTLSSMYRWDRQWTRAELEATLNASLPKLSKEKATGLFISPAFRPEDRIGELKKINVLQRGISGKVMALEVVGTKGTWRLQKEFVIRKALPHNGKMLPSANMVFSHMTDPKGRLLAVKVNGGGFGHGVGMSQLGASYMSKNGHKFPDIIRHYYKGIAIGTLPLTVGGEKGLNPKMTSFYAKEPQAILRVETDQPSPNPVKVQINGQELYMNVSENPKASVAIDKVIQPGTLNEVVLRPDPNDLQRRIKAWVEVYPAKL